jgi:hypothetical protein
MNRVVLLFVSLVTIACATETPSPALNPIRPDDPSWRELAAAFAKRGNVTANFAERRWFPFRQQPVELSGEVRVSAERGLSLHYRTPEQRIIVVDQQGLLIREAGGESSAPADPRAAAVNDALLHILRLDFGALEHDFELRGQRDAHQWSIELIPRSEELRRVIGRIAVSGADTAVWRIELRHSPKQYVEIQMSQPFPPTPFSPDELKRYFR